ncbi:MAG: hypothetical protein NW201_08875 [Gemmatimonadales bacterium]|nr:hypothetical protein [Gemmatimonadales bacterium]
MPLGLVMMAACGAPSEPGSPAAVDDVSPRAALSVAGPSPADTATSLIVGPRAEFMWSAELPRWRLDLTDVNSPGPVVSVAPGGNLQVAINNAACGSTIQLTAGGFYTGNFVLPAKRCPRGQWITIRTAAVAGQPGASARILSTAASNVTLATLQSPNGMATIRTAPGANRYRLLLLRIAAVPHLASSFGLVQFGEVGAGQATLDQVPKDLVMDRVLVDAGPTMDLQRCMTINSGATIVIRSAFLRCAHRQVENQAILGTNGPGPYLIEDNYLEAGSEHIMFGGADPTIQNLVPSDIVVRNNHFFRPSAWKGQFGVKNILEVKNGRRILFERNVLEGSWQDGQGGSYLVIFSANQGGNAPWSVARDITFRHNRVRNVGSGIALSGGNTPFPATPASRITVWQNVVDNVNVPPFTGLGDLVLIGGPVDFFRLQSNTMVSTGRMRSAMLFDVNPSASMTLSMNILSTGDNGIVGSGRTAGQPSLDFYAPLATVASNVLVGRQPGVVPRGAVVAPSLADVGFANVAAQDYRLLSTSPYLNPAAPTGADAPTVTTITNFAVRQRDPRALVP